jgi:type II secretory pathway component GspD/PulD (secretin)
LDWFEEAGTIFVSTKKIMRTFYLENARPSDIAQTVNDILPAGSKVSVDDTYNVLVIQTSSDYLPRLERLIKELDVSPPQVMIEVRMIEVRHIEGGNIGVDAKYVNPEDTNDIVQTKNLAGRPTDSGAQGLYAQVFSGDVESYLNALKTSAKFNTIASPRITTLSNKEATLLIGSKLGYKTTVVTETTTTQEINFLEVGTSLKLTPHVTKSGFIRMAVSPKLSDGNIVGDLPQENTTETKNEVMVKDGQTFIIGGLMRDKDTQDDYGVPLLMDIPLIGSLFRKTVITKEKHELLVFVTPHILTSENLEKLSTSGIEEVRETSRKMKARLIH